MFNTYDKLYLTPPELVRLGAMVELQKCLPSGSCWFIDHTVNNLACFGAVALGASILERHFTDSMNREGPDIICSLDTTACRELIEEPQYSPLNEAGKKEPTSEEQSTMDFAFATVVSIAPIEKGEVLTRENIWPRPVLEKYLLRDMKKYLACVYLSLSKLILHKAIRFTLRPVLPTVVITGASGLLVHIAQKLRLMDLMSFRLLVKIQGMITVNDYQNVPNGDILIHLGEDSDRGHVNSLGGLLQNSH